MLIENKQVSRNTERDKENYCHCNVDFLKIHFLTEAHAGNN
jgi:hypothetical protein